jgi:hypothetical protein
MHPDHPEVLANQIKRRIQISQWFYYGPLAIAAFVALLNVATGTNLQQLPIFGLIIIPATVVAMGATGYEIYLRTFGIRAARKRAQQWVATYVAEASTQDHAERVAQRTVKKTLSVRWDRSIVVRAFGTVAIGSGLLTFLWFWLPQIFAGG